MLRDQFPVSLTEYAFLLVSRHEDIMNSARDTEACSSRITEILVSGKPKSIDKTHLRSPSV
ncbi:MAG: hypothetical protein IPK30_03125 [Cellvibrionales bacterium]|nr:hypothetical protein [Cellvibrionales bacterium]